MQRHSVLMVVLFWLTNTVLASIACAAPTTNPTDSGPSLDVNLARRAVVCVECRLADGLPAFRGSGFLVSPDGLIFTNRHVVRPDLEDPDFDVDIASIIVGVPSASDPDDLEFYDAAVIYVAPKEDPLDFAILRIAARDRQLKFPTLQLSKDRVLLDEEVVDLGYPGGLGEDTPTLSLNRGRVSAARRRIDGKDYIQTDAAINYGNSGGPLLNHRGQVVGMVTLRQPTATNMGYALSAREIAPAAADAAKLPDFDSARPAVGPFDPTTRASKNIIDPLASNWDKGAGTIDDHMNHFVIDNDGKPYWVISKQNLPDNFRMVILATVVPYAGSNTRLDSVETEAIGSLCVRFGTDDVTSDVVVTKGYMMQLTDTALYLFREGQNIDEKPIRNTGRLRTITIVRKDSHIEISIGRKKIVSYDDPNPLPKQTKFCLGGTISRMDLGPVMVQDLGK